MINAQTISTESPVKRLMTIQGVLTVLGLVTGTAVIFLPFGAFGVYKDIVVEIGVFSELAGLSELSQGAFFRALPFLVLLLAVPISAGYLRWLLTGGLAPWASRTGYVLAVLAGLALLPWLGLLVFQVFSDLESSYAESVDRVPVVAAFCVLVPLAVGAWLVMRNQRVGLPHALNTLIALQVAYVASALMLLVLFGNGWGALFALLTVVVYVGQIVLGSLRKGGNES